MTELVAIHQPNFFPWLGFFDKIFCADSFIFLDDVQYPKSGAGGWSNRVKVLINGEGRWLTAPVDRSFHGTRTVNEMVFSSTDDWRARMMKSLVMAYRRSLHFDEALGVLEPLIQNPENNVALYNIHAIKALAAAVGLPTGHMVCSSTLPTLLSGTERLIDLTGRLGGQRYLCGGGAEGYQQDQKFEAAGMSLVYQEFERIPYPQHGTSGFTPGLSIIDAAMNLGWAGVGELLGSRPEVGRRSRASPDG
jgi:hypothetical protein